MQHSKQQCSPLHCNALQYSALRRRGVYRGVDAAPSGICLNTSFVEFPPKLAATVTFIDRGSPGNSFGFLGEDGGGGSVVEVVFAVPFEDAGQELDWLVRIGRDPVAGDASVITQELVDVGRDPSVGCWGS